MYFGAHGFRDGQWVKGSDVQREGTRIVAYVARSFHGVYPRAGSFRRIYGLLEEQLNGKGAVWRANTVIPLMQYGPWGVHQQHKRDKFDQIGGKGKVMHKNAKLAKNHKKGDGYAREQKQEEKKQEDHQINVNGKLALKRKVAHQADRKVGKKKIDEKGFNHLDTSWMFYSGQLGSQGVGNFLMQAWFMNEPKK